MSLSKTLYPLLSTGYPRKTRPGITENLLTGAYIIKSNKTNLDLYSCNCICKPDKWLSSYSLKPGFYSIENVSPPANKRSHIKSIALLAAAVAATAVLLAVAVAVYCCQLLLY